MTYYLIIHISNSEPLTYIHDKNTYIHIKKKN